MKKEKGIIVLFIIIALLFNVCSTIAFAADSRPYEEPDENVEFPNLYAIRSNKFEFSPHQFLKIYADNSSTPTTSEYIYNKVLKYRQSLDEGILVPIHSYENATTGVELQVGDEVWTQELDVNSWNDEVIDGKDASMFLALSVGGSESSIAAKRNQEKIWSAFVKMLKYSLADELNISRDDVTVYIDVNIRAISEFNTSANGFTTNSEDMYTDEVMAKMLELETLNETINRNIGNQNNAAHQIVKIRATTTNNGNWNVVLGTDNNFYFLKEETDEETEPIGNIGEFDTDLKYSDSVADAEGTLKNGTFMPPYTEDDINKKDADVTAIISSKTDEGISVTNDVIVKTDRTPNEKGWSYTDAEHIKSIEKKYLFDEYDNTTYNGIVNETVKLIGNDDGRDTQEVSIKWTFRRKAKTEKENEDGSVTVTITYNLPVDSESIPEGWSPVYDKDGKTIHAIEKTIKKGEDYDKDVIVKQNGTDATVTTPVSKKWPKEEPVNYTGKKDDEADNLGPQAGAYTAVLAIVIVGTIVFAISRYRKMNK